MNNKKLITLLILLISMIVVGCDNEKNSKKENSITKVKVDSIMFDEFNNLLETVYDAEPHFTSEDWINEDGKLLFPYENNEELMRGIDNILASLYMPQEVLEKASTEDLLKVVCDGWLSTYATSPTLYNNASEYIAYCTKTNQAANELIQRSDMAKIVYKDYCNRSYIEGGFSEEAAFELNKLQFEEIVLGSNHAFLMLDDSTRKKVLTEILEKNEDIESGDYYLSGLKSGFFSMIEEEYNNGNSEWYSYICENNLDEAQKYIDIENPSWRN